jgi:hypothetical protein
MGRRSTAATPAPNQIAASIPRFGYTERQIATAAPKDCPDRRDAARTPPALSLPSHGTPFSTGLSGLSGGWGYLIGLSLLAAPPPSAGIFDIACRLVLCGIGFALLVTEHEGD